MTGRGVFAGASTAYQPLNEKPGTPASASVGSVGQRRGARARRDRRARAACPFLTIGSVERIVPKYICTKPASEIVVAGVAALVRNVHDVDARHALEQLGAEVRDAARARRQRS